MEPTSKFGRVMAGLALITTTFLSGCARESEPAAPWSAQFAEAYRIAESDFVRSILASGTIETSDVEESRQRMLECMRDAGLQVDVWGNADQGGFTFLGEMTDADRRIEAQCDAQWSGPIPGLYVAITQNPQNVDRSELVAACIVRHGLAPDGFTGRDFDELANQAAAVFDGTETDAEREAILQQMLDAPPVLLPDGTPINDGVAWECQLDPNH